MKFDLFAWDECRLGVDLEHHDTRLRVVVSRPSALFVIAEGFEVCAGYGTEFDLTFGQPVSFRVEGPKDARAFVNAAFTVASESRGQVFTNFESAPADVGHLAAVKHALRQQQLEQRAFMAELRREKRELEEKRAAHAAQVASQAPASDVVEPVEEANGV